MIIAITILSIIVALNLIYLTRKFFDKYKIGFYYIDKHQEAEAYEAEAEALEKMGIMPMNPEDAMDLRGTPTHKCVCGCNIWNIKAIFEDYEIATYFLDMQCAHCGSMATAPTPLDRENTE